MKLILSNLFFVFLLINPNFLFAEDGSGLKISASGDLVGQAGLHQGSGASDRLDVREAEFMLYAPADHIFDAALSFAAHYEGGVANLELHEAYLGSSKLVPRSRFRLGQFFLGVGRLNQFHRHDWPFITAPKVQAEMFDAHGILDTGAEYSFLFPTPFFLELTAGMTNGFTYGHDHTSGARPLMPTHYARLATYTGLPLDGGTQIGLNYVGRRGGEGTQRTLLGVDITAKWKDASVLQFLLQSEIWYRELTPAGEITQKALGLYVYPQYYLGANFFLGARLDYFSNIVLPDALGGTSKNFNIGLVPTLSYKASEFSTLRLAYNHEYTYLVDRFTGSQRMVEFQAIFILGAHPAHDF